MTGWAGGYVADIVYQPGVYTDQMPAHLDLICHLEGVHAPRRPGEPFRYCELGCGLGETALLIAVLHPEAEVVGYDFNPAHIDYARFLARAAGVSNVLFEEKSFADIAGEPSAGAPQFDYVTLHGIWTWVARARQLEIIDILNTRLRPGGLAYVTYNALPYWSENLAFQRLVLDLAETSTGRSDVRINEALDVVRDIEAAGAPILRKSHLESVLGKRRHDSAYLAHEYLNQNSRPVYHADLARDLADAKLDFVGSAIPLDNFPQIVFSPDQRAILEKLPAQVRTTVGDYFYPHLFRRDVFVRGARALGRQLRTKLLLDRTLALTGQLEDFEPKTRNARDEISFDAPFYAFLARELAQGPAALGALRARFGDGRMPDAREVLAFGLQTGQFLTFDPAADPGSVRAVNKTLVAAAFDDMRSGMHIAAAGLRTAMHLNVPDMLTYLALANGISEAEETVVEFADAFLERRGASLRKTAEEPGGGGLDELRREIGTALRFKAPVWRTLQAL